MRAMSRTASISRPSQRPAPDAWPPSKRSVSLKPKGTKFRLGLLVLWGVALAISAYHAYDPFTWVLEVFPAVIAVAVLAVTYRRFSLTNLLYFLIFMHSLILMGG